MTTATIAARDKLAAITVAALQEKTEAEITMGWTTAGCPIVRVDFGGGVKFNLVVTRSRS